MISAAWAISAAIRRAAGAGAKPFRITFTAGTPPAQRPETPADAANVAPAPSAPAPSRTQPTARQAPARRPAATPRRRSRRSEPAPVQWIDGTDLVHADDGPPARCRLCGQTRWWLDSCGVRKCAVCHPPPVPSPPPADIHRHTVQGSLVERASTAPEPFPKQETPPPAITYPQNYPQPALDSARVCTALEPAVNPTTHEAKP